MIHLQSMSLCPTFTKHISDIIFLTTCKRNTLFDPFQSEFRLLQKYHKSLLFKLQSNKLCTCLHTHFAKPHCSKNCIIETTGCNFNSTMLHWSKWHIVLFFSNILLLLILVNNGAIILLQTYTSCSTLCTLFKCLRFKSRLPALGFSVTVLCSVYGTHIFIWPWLTEPVLINIQGWVDLRLEQEEAPAVVNETTLALWRGSMLKLLMVIVGGSCLMGVSVSVAFIKCGWFSARVCVNVVSMQNGWNEMKSEK